jgi:hypothetical protein
VSRSAELAAVLGGAALAGVGLAPFLHREPEPETWFRLHWPRDLDEDQALGLLRHLASTRRPNVITFEVRALKHRLVHLVGVAKADTERLRHSFATFLPDVLLEPVERPTPHLARAVELRLGSRERALRTDAPSEVARSVLGAIAGTSGITVVQYQLGTRLAPSHVSKDSHGLPTVGRALGQAFRYGLAPLDAIDRRNLQSKVGEQGFRIALRIGTNISDRLVGKGVLRAVIGGLRVAEAPGVHFTVRRTGPGAVATASPPRRFVTAFNVAELVGLLAWPLGDGAYPGVDRVGSRLLPVPAAVPSKGRVIGAGTHPSSLRPVAQSARDGLMHTEILGPTGVGKSTLLVRISQAEIEAGRGLIVIEPKGDLVADILARLPQHRERDVVVLDPTDRSPVGLNPLQGGSAELVSDQIVAVFRGLYGDYLGPRTADVLHAALLTLARAKDATLVALPRLLTDQRLRRELTQPVRDDLALGPFWAWYESLSDDARSQVIAPVMNKLRPFVLRENIRHVLGQPQPRFNIGDVFTENKILLVPLNKGALGSETASLLGSLVVARLWQAVQGRGRVAPGRRSPVALVIDEFQDFLHLPTDLADVLAQARGLGLGLVLAHQHLAQLTPPVRAAVLANARSRIAFRLSAEDATVIAKATDLLDASDFQSLGRYEAYASLVANSETQPFASIRTEALPAAGGDMRRVRDSSRELYGVARDEIEAALHALAANHAPGADESLGTRKRRQVGDGGRS